MPTSPLCLPSNTLLPSYSFHHSPLPKVINSDTVSDINIREGNQINFVISQVSNSGIFFPATRLAV